MQCQTLLGCYRDTEIDSCGSWKITEITWEFKDQLNGILNEFVRTTSAHFFIIVCTGKKTPVPRKTYNVGASSQHQTAVLYCAVASNIFFFFVFGCVVFVFERSFPSVLLLLSACLMYQSFRWGVTGMALSFRREELSVFQLLRQV